MTTRLEQAQEALLAAQAALEAVRTEASKVNAQEADLRRRYPASSDALERATISLALSQEIPALQRRVESRRLSAERDVDAAQRAVQVVQAEIAELRAAIAERIRRTEPGGWFATEIDAIRADADRRIAALAASCEAERGDLPGMQARLEQLGGTATARNS
jgi:predicted  nucleic acid-binding Zn-ribbon protein